MMLINNIIRNKKHNCTIPAFQLILLTTFLLHSISFARAQEVVASDADVPPNKWYIDTPVFNQSRLDLYLTYRVSDYIPYENLGWTLYDSLDCDEGSSDITENDYLTTKLEGPINDVPEGDGNSYRQFTMAFSFDPDTIRTSPIIHEEGLKTRLKFCVRLSAFTAPTNNPVAVEMFYKQTTLTLDIRQEGNADVDGIVIDTDNIGNEQAQQLYMLVGYLCNATNHQVFNPNPIFQGMPTRVCVTPDAEARASGVYMRSIDSFYWTRDTIFQTAIYPHQQAAPLTEIECEPGMIVCAFTTILKASFFFKRGQVGGAGYGWLQFGRGDYVGDARQRWRRASIVMFQDESAGNAVSDSAATNPATADPLSVISRNNGIGYYPPGTLLAPRQAVNDNVNHNNYNRNHSVVAFQDESGGGGGDASGSNTTTTANNSASNATTTNGTTNNTNGPERGQDYGIGPTTRQQVGGDGEESDANFRPAPGGIGSPGYAGEGPFQVDIPVTRLYNAIGYLCNADNVELNPLENPLTKGDKARVCVKPNSLALLDDVRIRVIDSFSWFRADTQISQTAITSNAVAATKTQIFCPRGSLVCAFETQLNDNFFGTPGRIDGTGIVWLQFGSSKNSARMLQYDLGFSLLPDMEAGFAGATPFSAYVFTIPPPDSRELYTCRAYECDFDNREIVTTEAKTQGSSVRMCVKPSAAAVEAGAKMWSIEWWEWSQVNLNQTAIEPQGIEASDGRTLLMCQRGMDVCFFQTRLNDNFFQLQTNGISGDGHCWITFGNGLISPGGIEMISSPAAPDGAGSDAAGGNSEGEGEREVIDPTKDALYAGQSDISIYFPVTGNYVEDLSCPPEIHSLDIWWENFDPTLKALIVACIIGTGAGVCCLFAFCFFGNRRKVDEEDEEYLEENGKIVVNVDVEDVHHTDNRVHRQYEERKDYSLDTKTTTTSSSKKTSSSSGNITEGSSSSFSGKPSDDDVCFGDPSHPGTKDCRNALKSYMKKNPDASFGPDVYKAIKKRMEDRHLLIKESRNSSSSSSTSSKNKKKWREATKAEAITAIGEMWRELKYAK